VPKINIEISKATDQILDANKLNVRQNEDFCGINRVQRWHEGKAFSPNGKRKNIKMRYKRNLPQLNDQSLPNSISPIRKEGSYTNVVSSTRLQYINSVSSWKNEDHTSPMSKKVDSPLKNNQLFPLAIGYDEINKIIASATQLHDKPNKVRYMTKTSHLSS
jgi:hypothetical protein